MLCNELVKNCIQSPAAAAEKSSKLIGNTGVTRCDVFVGRITVCETSLASVVSPPEN